MSGWWTDRPAERFWLEATDRPDIGSDLRAPLADAAGRENWRYTLFRAARSGDVVFHYDAGARAIVAWSTVTGASVEAPIVWAARGSYARDRGAQPAPMPGYRVPLGDTRMLAEPVTLERIRARKPQLIEMMTALREAVGGGPLYFPFELSESRPVRPLQGYAFKLPVAFVELFGLFEVRPDAERPSAFRLSTNAREARKHFNTWRKALLETAERKPALWRLRDEGIVFRNQAQAASAKLGPRTALGLDASGRSWAVQLNEAAEPGDANVTTAIAIRTDGRPFLLRQGRLQAGAGAGEVVTQQQFRIRTGRAPVVVSNGDTRITRDWHIVTALDVPNDQIRRATADFVELCMLARDRRPASDPEKKQVLDILYGSNERGGTYRLAGRPATEGRDVLRLQGEVWEALATTLAAHGVELNKPRPARRYEVDGVVAHGKVRLLIEIKCSNEAVDIYTGCGQLMLYRKLMHSLADHTPVLLLPRQPHPVMAAAVDALGVTIAIYEIRPGRKRVKIVFPEATRSLCGLPGKG